MSIPLPLRVGLALTLLAAAPVAVRTQARPDPAELIADIDKAFAAPRTELKPGLLIFPVLGADDRVAPDGGAIAYLAAHAAVYTDRRLLDVCVPLMRDVLDDAGCLKAGAALDDETIRLCLAALGVKRYAVPKLIRQGDNDVLTINCHGDGDRVFTHTVKPSEHRRIPGLIAQSVQEYLGVPLKDEERRRVAAPTVRDEDDLRKLLNAVAGRLPTADVLALLERNPRCAPAWELALTRIDTRTAARARFDQLRPPLECPRVHLAAAVAVRESGEPERALRMLLPHAASHRGDTYFHSTMMKCAMRLRDERLVRRVLELWRKDEPGYAGDDRRGENLTEWAWDARGSGFANQVTPDGARKFEERLQEAGRELRKAVRANPDGWTAHTRLLTVARGLGLPREVMEDHFSKAVKLRPRYALAYQLKLEYLRPRWHGTPEELLEFGRECAATGFWDEGIPLLFSRALHDCHTSPRDSGRVCAVLQAPDVWDAVREYYRSARKGARPAARRHVLNEVVRWGILGEHFDDDLVLACQHLRGRVRLDPGASPDRAELEFLYDLVHARTGRLMTPLFGPGRNDLALARTAAALAEGDCDQADKFIEQIEPGPSVNLDTVATYRAAIEAGRKLVRDGSLDLQGADGLRTFLGGRTFAKYGRDSFVLEVKPHSRAELIFPVGFRHGVIRGTVDWSAGISYAQIVAHTRALRDQVVLRYLPGNTVQLLRNNVLLSQAARPAGPSAFRLVYDGQADQLEPAPGVAWSVGVYDDVPSGFAFQIITADRPATVTLRGLHIERTD